MAEGSAGNLYVIYEAFYLITQLNPLPASNEKSFEQLAHPVY